MMFKVLSGLWKFFIIAIIFLVVRSPILMGIIGFTSGVMFYHEKPDIAQHWIQKTVSLFDEKTGMNISIITKPICKLPNNNQKEN